MPKRSREDDPYARNYATGAGERRQRRVVNTTERLRASNSLRPITNRDMLQMYIDYRNGNEDQRQQIKNNYTGAFVLPQLNQRGIPMDVINEQIGGFLGYTFNPHNNRLEDQNLPEESLMERERRRHYERRDKLEERAKQSESNSLLTRRLDRGPYNEKDVSIRLEKDYNFNNPRGSRKITYLRVLNPYQLAAVRRGDMKYLPSDELSLLEENNNVPNDVEQGLRYLASEGNSFANYGPEIIKKNRMNDYLMNKMRESTHRSMGTEIGLPRNDDDDEPRFSFQQNKYRHEKPYMHDYNDNDYLELGTQVGDRVLPQTSHHNVSRRLPTLYTPVAQVGQQPRQNALDLFHTLAAQRRHLRN